MAGTKFITCLVCFEKSRHRPGWWCGYCGHMRPEPLGVEAIPREIKRPVLIKPQPRPSVMTKTEAKAQRKAEADSVAQAIAKVDRDKLPDVISGLRLKAGLRKS